MCLCICTPLHRSYRDREGEDDDIVHQSAMEAASDLAAEREQDAKDAKHIELEQHNYVGWVISYFDTQASQWRTGKVLFSLLFTFTIIAIFQTSHRHHHVFIKFVWCVVR